jgi:hypothetical protein
MADLKGIALGTSLPNVRAGVAVAKLKPVEENENPVEDPKDEVLNGKENALAGVEKENENPPKAEEETVGASEAIEPKPKDGVDPDEEKEATLNAGN